MFLETRCLLDFLLKLGDLRSQAPLHCARPQAQEAPRYAECFQLQASLGLLGQEFGTLWGCLA